MYENLTIYILLLWTEIFYKQQMVFIVHDLKYVLLDISEHQEVLNSMSLTLRTPTQTMKIYDDANINISTFHEFAFKCN